MNTTQPSSKIVQIACKAPVTASIAAMAILVAFFSPLASLLQYDRMAIAGGELWRLATCYLTHWNFDHLSWDLLMFVVLGAVCEIRNPRKMILCLGAGVVVVSSVVTLMFPAIDTYRGLSGLDTALFALLATELLCEAWHEKNKMQVFAFGGLLFAFGAKTSYEAVTGHTFFVDEQVAGFVPLVFDHVAGAVVGAAVAIIGGTARAIETWPPSRAKAVESNI